MTDRELVHRITQRGEKNLFAEVVRRHSGMVYSRAMGVVHRDELAAEVTQQTFVKAYEQLSLWHGNELGAWLSIIAVHTALHIVEKERRHNCRPVDEVANSLADSFDAEREERLQRMERALDELSEEDQRLIRLHYYEHRRTADIAALVGMTQANVLVRLHRIRERLKQRLETNI